MTNLLFICSRNQWRSPTGEQVWRNHPEVSVRSAGTSPKARRTVSVKDIQWADIIFVMEQKHKSRLKAQFTRLLEHKDIHVLDIPDEYQYMDEKLIEIMKQAVGGYLGVLAQACSDSSPFFEGAVRLDLLIY
ncbi:phosphotyrosine protein phosphatase [uncultured Shewanella sp.]|uniref:low molecular weight protein tyrosine phosphatase family protein n=1 Tax=uncultured Shewanella sp. TaxID=173975 RepID=UPI00260C5E6F|nr:phosphotyrosine protein phosphatase [uncultured Shewanella sp.]